MTLIVIWRVYQFFAPVTPRSIKVDDQNIMPAKGKLDVNQMKVILYAIAINQTKTILDINL